MHTPNCFDERTIKDRTSSEAKAKDLAPKRRNWRSVRRIEHPGVLLWFHKRTRRDGRILTLIARKEWLTVNQFTLISHSRSYSVGAEDLRAQ